MVVDRLKVKGVYLLLFLIVFIGVFLRLWDVFWGMERNGKIYITGPTFVQDENFTVFHTLKKSIDKNPHYFINPDLYYSLCYWSFIGLKTLGLVKINGSMVYQRNSAVMANRMSYLYMLRLARILSAFFGILSIIMVFFIGKRLFNEWVGLLASALFSLSYLSVFYSKLAVVESLGVFTGLLMFYWGLADTSRRNFFIVSFLFAIAMSVKYLNVYLFLPFLFILWKNRRLFTIKDYFIILGIFVFTFLIINPYVLLSFGEFLFGDKKHFGGIFGSRGLLSYNNFSFSPFGFIYLTVESLGYLGFILFIIGLFYIIKDKKDKSIYLLIFLSVFYVTLIFNSTPHLRHILYALPILFIIVSYGIYSLIKAHKLFWIVPVLLFVVFTLSSYKLNLYLKMDDTRVMADEWILKNVRSGVRIGLSYNVVSQSRGFLTYDNTGYKVKYIKCRCDLLNEFMPDLFITTEDKLNPFYEPNPELKSFLKYLYQNYSLINVFETPAPLKRNPPEDIKYIVHPNVYVFQRR